MNYKIKLLNLGLMILLFFLIIGISHAQVDSSNVAKSLISIGDSTALSDSAKSIVPKTKFLIHFEASKFNGNTNPFILTKKEIDFTDYRYSGNIVSYLPFGSLNDFGSLGTPNETNLYNFGFGNISVIIDNFSLTSIVNSSNDLNIFQTEEISSIYIPPITRGFLYGFASNPSSLIIETNDTLKSKPVTRLRYYQSSNEEGFVDAMFSARILPRLALAIRLTNSSIDENYKNTEFGTWKFNVKGIYKLSDSLFTKLNFNHAKLNTPLNGGINISQFLGSSDTKLNFYGIEFPVYFEDRKKTTTKNDVTGSIYGKLLPFGYTKLNISFSEAVESLQYTVDTNSTKLNNYSRSLSSTFSHRLSANNFSSNFNAGFEKIDLKVDEIFPKTELNNYYASLSLQQNFFNGSITPSIFGKYSYFNGQSAVGFGSDISIEPIDNLKLLIGYSGFEKPLTPIESQYLEIKNTPSHNVLFSSINFNRNNFMAGVSFFSITSKNNVTPIFRNEANSDDMEYVFDNKSINSGINFRSNIKFWNILTTTNLNFYWQNKSQFETKDNIFSIDAGIFYVDTLYNDNLNLKTGFIFKLFDNPNYSIYNFQHMRSATYSIVDEAINKLSLQSVLNDKMRLDFYLAGRIQDAATFYFIYENILGNNYFIVPYYPMPEGGMRIGISWDFLD